MKNKEKLRLIYEHCKVNQPRLVKEIDKVVSKDKSLPQSVMENVGRLLSKNGILHNNCMILESKKIKDQLGLKVALLESLKKDKKLYNKNVKVLEHYTLKVGGKNIIPSRNLKAISEAFSYNRSVNESRNPEALKDLSNLPLTEGQWEIDNYADFAVNFPEEWMNANKDLFTELEHWFSNGGVLTLNIYSDENSLTGYNASLSWSDGESTFPDHTKINYLVKQYVTDSIIDYYITEALETQPQIATDTDTDDFDMTEYHLDQSLEYGVKYQVIESNVPDLTEFDEIEVVAKEKSIGGKITIKVNGTDTLISINPADYSSVLLAKLDDYDVIMEDDDMGDLGDMGDMGDAGSMDFGDINESIEQNLDSTAIEVLLQRCKTSPECVIPCGGSLTDYIYWDQETNGWERYSVDEFGIAEISQANDYDVYYNAALYLLAQANAGVNVDEYAIEDDPLNVIDVELTYKTIRESGRLSEMELDTFTAAWSKIINNSDLTKKQKNEEISTLLDNWYISDLMTYKQQQLPVDAEYVAAKLHEMFPLVSVEDIYATLTDGDIKRYLEITNDASLDDDMKQLSLQKLIDNMFPYGY